MTGLPSHGRQAPRAQDWARGYAIDGYAHLGTVLDEPQILDLRDAIDTHLDGAAAAAGVADRGAYQGLVSVWPEPSTQSPVFEQLRRRRDLAMLAATASGSASAHVIRQQVVFRPPRAGRALPYHQDLPQWPTEDPRSVAIWLALDDADEDSGALRYVPGSHLGDVRAAPIPAPVGAGQALLHHALIWHTGGANRTDRWRRAVVMVFAPRCSPLAERSQTGRGTSGLAR